VGENLVKKGRSLVEFMHDKRRQDCRICALPQDVRQEMLTASKKKYRQADVLEWLKADRDIDISEQEMASHYSGKHDRSF